MALLNFLENAGKQIARPFVAAGADVSNAIGNAEVRAGQALGIQAKTGVQTNQQQFGNSLGNYVGTNTPMHFAENVGQVGLAVGTGGLGDAAAGAVGLGDIGGLAGGAVKGALGGASTGGAFNALSGASQGQTSGHDLTMNFLEGTAGGAALGAAGGAVGGVISDAKATLIAKNDSEKFAQKQLEPDVGPVIANRVAPAVAGTKDPNIVQNIVGNEVDKVHQPANDLIAQQQAASAPPPEGAPTSPGTPDTTRSPELQAQEGMQNILNQGGTVDEALNHHMETTGSNIGQAQTALKAVTGAAGTDKGQINASLNPEFGKLQIPQADSNERAVLNSRMVRNQVTRVGNAATAEVDKLSKNDMALLDQRGDPSELVNQAEDKDQFMKAATAVKKYNDTTQALGAGQLEQDVPYRQNYGAPLKFDRSTPEGEAAFQDATAKLPNTPGYGKGRFFKNYDDASQISNGELKRQNENFLGDLHQDIQQRQSDLAQLTLAKGLNEANPGQVRIGKPGTGDTGTDRQLLIPGGNKIFMPRDLADEINKRAPAPQASGAFAGYDALNSNLKNLKLAGGGFHSVNVIGSYLGQQLSSGKLFTPTGMKDLGSVIHTTFSQRAMDSELGRLGDKGTLINADAAGLKYGRGETAADVEPTAIGNKIPVLKQIHAGIFDRQIPMLKLKLFEQQTKGLDRNNPDDLKQMTQVSKTLNNAFGGLNREIQGLNPRQFQIAARAFLATDYNEGQLRTLGNAFTSGGAEGKLAREIVFGKALLFGGLATAGGYEGGEFQGKDPKQVAYDILQKVANPSFTIGGNKVGLPTTQIAEVAKPAMETVQGAKAGNPASGVENFASARLAAIPSLGEQLGTNKNFTGQQIYGNDKLGRPVAPGTTAANVASTALPIPASQAVQTATGKESTGAAIANTVGLRVSPQYNVQNLPAGTQTYIKEAQQVGASKEQLNAMTSYFGILRQTTSDRSKATKAAVSDLAKGDSQGAQAEITKYNQSLLKSLAPWAQKNSQYMDNTMYAQLTQDFSSPFTASGLGLLKLPSATTVKKDVQANPEKYGLSISGGAITQ